VLRRLAFVALLAVAAVLAGCGAARPRSAAPDPAQLQSDLQGSPPALAALHAQASRLLPGGLAAFRARLAALHGHPVVVNNWASWCDPCQSEFPVFQQVSASLGRQVAFLGINGKDVTPAAAAFLRRFPVSYPSYSDPSGTIGSAVLISALFPETAFYGPGGQRVYIHPGPYLKPSELLRDIRFYILR
jgi:thiol-disulfide isomerase/thioredoxin